jgi:hypothetical protein
MTRTQLEHLIRAAAVIADDDELVIVGSQSILGQFPHAPAVLLVSVEADLYPKNHPERADLIDGTIGELSPFHDTFGYYAQGVGEATATLPDQWQQRLVPIRNENTRNATGWCLDVHDLVLSKCVARRDKDIRFIRDVIAHRLVDEAVLRARIETLPLSSDRIALISTLIEADLHHARAATV